MNQSILGTTIDGKYSVRTLLGSGGLGSVYRAEQGELARAVAIKVLHGAVINDEVSRARFEREARVLALLENEHIVGVYSYGTLPNGHPFMAMEFLEGKTLSEVLAAEGRIPWDRLVTIGSQICQALQAAHKQGVVHRDLKPQNIMLLPKPQPDYVKVLDFGLSKLLAPGEEPTQKITQTGSIVGSVFYMSPEVCAGMVADERSDVYSLGCILYECLTGRLPLESDHPFEMLHKHRTELPPRISSVIPPDQIPEQLELIVFKALAKEPDDRFQTMEEMQRALDLLHAGRASELTLSGVKISPPPKPRFSNVAIIGAGMVALLVLGGVALGVYFSKRNMSQQEVAQMKKQNEAQKRADDIARAKGFAEQAARAKISGNVRQAELNAERALQLICRTLPRGAMNEANSRADLEVMRILGPIYADLPVQAKNTKMRYMGVLLGNDSPYLTVDEQADLMALQANVSFAHGFYNDAACRWCSASMMYSDARSFTKAKDLIEQMKAVKYPDLLAANGKFFLDLAQGNYLCSRGKKFEAVRYAKACYKDMEEIGNEGQAKYQFLIELFKLEQKLPEKQGAWRTLKELEHLLSDPSIFGRTEEQIMTHDVVGRDITTRQLDDSVRLLTAVQVACDNPEMKAHVDGALQSVIKLRQEVEAKANHAAKL